MNQTTDGRTQMGLTPNRIYALAAALAVAALILALAIAETLGAAGLPPSAGLSLTREQPPPRFAALAADPSCQFFDSTLREVETRRADVGA